MAPIRIVFFALAFVALLGTGWMLSRTAEMYQFHDENIARAEKDKKELEAYTFDKDGNVPPDKRADFELALFSVKLSTQSIAHSKEQVAIGRMYSSIGIGATLLFAVLGLVVGRKKPAK